MTTSEATLNVCRFVAIVKVQGRSKTQASIEARQALRSLDGTALDKGETEDGVHTRTFLAPCAPSTRDCGRKCMRQQLAGYRGTHPGFSYVIRTPSCIRS